MRTRMDRRRGIATILRAGRHRGTAGACFDPATLIRRCRIWIGPFSGDLTGLLRCAKLDRTGPDMRC